MNASENTVARHLSNSIDMMINGAMRKIETELPAGSNTDRALGTLISRIHAECDDWAESIDNHAATPGEISVGLNVPRTPFNLTSAIIDLMNELDQLNGIEDSVDRIMAEIKRLQKKDGIAAARVQQVAALRTQAVYHMPAWTTEQDAIAIAHGCKLAVLKFKPAGETSTRAECTVIGSMDRVAAMTADLSYGPVRFETPEA